MNSVWNESEKQFIKENAPLLSDKEGAKKLSAISGRTITVHSYRKQRQRMSIKKAPGRGVCRTIAGEDARKTIVVVADNDMRERETVVGENE